MCNHSLRLAKQSSYRIIAVQDAQHLSIPLVLLTALGREHTSVLAKVPPLENNLSSNILPGIDARTSAPGAGKEQ